MKYEEKLSQIEFLLVDFLINTSLLKKKLMDKYDNDMVCDEQYLNDSKFIKDLTKIIGIFLNNEQIKNNNSLDNINSISIFDSSYRILK